MDPEACVLRWCKALAAGDDDEAYEAAEDYNAWIDRGGYPVRLFDDTVSVCELGGHSARLAADQDAMGFGIVPPAEEPEEGRWTAMGETLMGHADVSALLRGVA